MEEHELIELRSDDVQEILGTPPSWLVRWGTTVMVALIVMLLGLAYFIRYPDIINAVVVITTSQPPTSVVARSDGNLAKLLVEEKQNVKAGEIIAIMQSTANYQDVVKIDEFVRAFQNKDVAAWNDLKIDKNLLLGELQTDYYAFIQALDIYNFTKSSGFAQVNTSQLQAQIAKMQKDYELIKRRIAEVRSDKLPSAERFASQQRTLFTQGVASKNDLENANSRVFEVKNEISSLESSLVNKEVEIGNARSQITVIQQGANQGNTDKVIKVKETIAALRASIDRWKQTFLLIAPIEGRVSFFGKYWKEQQFVKTGDEVMVIVPEERQEQQKIVGKVNMPITGAGKVKEGQRVVMFLDSYPYEEFGSVDGKIESISLVPKDNMYTIQVAIPGDKIVTNYKKIIPQTQQLSGNAQIITEDKRFIQRIMDKVWGLTKKY